MIHVQTVLQVYLHADAKTRFSKDDAMAVAMERLQRFVAEELDLFQQQPREPGEKPPERVVSHVRQDAPGEEIAQLAADLEADLVVVGTHGRTGLARLLLGSVAHKVVTLAPCQVLVVRPKRMPQSVPAVEPPCPRCMEVRRQSVAGELWCEQHREHHGQRRRYYQDDRSSVETNFPLVFELK